MQEIAALKKHIINYSKTRDVYDEVGANILFLCNKGQRMNGF